MKILILLIGLIVIAGGGWYVYSIVSDVQELDELSPLAADDALDTMGEAVRMEFNKAVEDMKDVIKEMNDPMPLEAPMVLSGDFMPRAHDVAGRALLIEQDSIKTLRFENFETINGPNLHIYLSSDLGVGDAIDLGGIKATKGNVNYEIDSGVDTARYNKVLVWCEPFRVLFSYAELK